jgi:hypothetical protein
VRVRVTGLDGKVLDDRSYPVQAAANARTPVAKPELATLAAGHTVLIKLDVTDAGGAPVSDNFYWWAKDESTLRELNSLPQASVTATLSAAGAGGERRASVKIKNAGAVPALLIKLTLKDAASGRRILPAYYSDNYFSMLPGEERTVTIEFPAGSQQPAAGLRGWNLGPATVSAR